jgi:branched-subunit amino acid aminotransferase/4-amino-4-deoxychorismate lyase
VLAVAEKEGFELEKREIRFGDLLRAGGAFITSTSSKIIPVRSIDDQKFAAPPEALRSLMDAFDAFLAKCGGVI